MPRRSDARPRAIRATSVLLQRQGYAATGLEEILTTSGAPKGSFYFHFPGGKEQLATEALTEGGHAVREALHAVLDGAATSGEAVRRFAELEARQLERSRFERGCPIATVALEMASRSDSVRRAADAAFESWVALLASRLVDDGVPRADARVLAQWAIATLEGALVLARASRDAAIIRALAEPMATVLDAATGG
jgi:TetR/AcrR family transcriptional regulator, lmrAB and yxaGH operons repressor